MITDSAPIAAVSEKHSELYLKLFGETPSITSELLAAIKTQRQPFGFPKEKTSR